MIGVVFYGVDCFVEVLLMGCVVDVEGFWLMVYECGCDVWCGVVLVQMEVCFVE